MPMFEKTQPQPIIASARFASARAVSGDLMVGRAVELPDAAERRGSALRMIEWGELTARLNAARDLRTLLRRDVNGNIESNGGSFVDAAARYFRAREETEHNERDVNPVVLEQNKGSCGISGSDEETLLNSRASQDRGYAATGDARED